MKRQGSGELEVRSDKFSALFEGLEMPESVRRERPLLSSPIDRCGSFCDDWAIRRFAAKARRLSERLNSAKDVPGSPLTEIA